MAFLLCSGGYTAYRLHFFCFLHPISCVKTLFARESNASVRKNENSYSPTKALTLALAGTLGVGNITGVAAAIALGGAGALFWMWVSALCTMLIKYAEVYLAVRTRESHRVYHKRTGKTETEYRGGPMRYFQFFRHGGILAAVFCILCVTASFIQGNLLQTGAAVSCAAELTGISPYRTAAFMTLFAAILMFGGRARIASFTEKMIPLMTGLYLLMGIVVMIRNAAMLPSVLQDILKSAFSVRAAAGGGGISMLLAMRHGCAKGIFSHEAGCGTSPISHAGAMTDSPEKQGILGIAEVFVDTIILCTVTGFVFLLSKITVKPIPDAYTDAVIRAFSVYFGDAAAWFLCISIVFYAFSTMLCWSFYGTECVRYLLSRKKPHTVRFGVFLYLSAYAACTFFGAFLSADCIWHLSDILTMTMTALNTTAVVGLLSLVGTPDFKTASICFRGKQKIKSGIDK